MESRISPKFFFEGGSVLQRVFLMYGNLSDYYVTPSHSWHSFEKAIAAHLKHMGYECVLFFDGTYTLECADEASAKVRIEKFKTRREIQNERRKEMEAAEEAEKKEESKPANKGATIGVGRIKAASSRASARKRDGGETDKDELSLRFSVDTKEVPEYLDGVMRSKVKSAIIFCNCVTLLQPNADKDGVSMSEMAKKMGRWYGLPAENSNIAVMLFDMPSTEILRTTLSAQHIWHFLLGRAFFEEKVTDAVIRVGGPLNDEIRCFLHDTLPEYVNVAELPEGCSRGDVERAAMNCVKANRDSLKALKNFIHAHEENALEELLKEYGGVQEDALESIGNTPGWEAVYEMVKRIIEKAKMARGEETVSLPFYSDTNLRMAYAGSVNALDVNLSMILQGNPGTGKTTVVEKIAKAFCQNGLLTSDRVHKVTRKDLVGEYIGHTAVKTAAQIEAAMGGVLFVDEAYELFAKRHDNHSGDFGQEAIGVILEAISNLRGQISIVLAGYPEDMRHFLSANSGLPRRFDNNIVTIPDYPPELLEGIFLRRLEEYNESSRNDRIPGDTIFRISMELLGEAHVQDVPDGRAVDPLICLEMAKRDREAKKYMPLNLFFNNWYADRERKTFGNADAAIKLAERVAEKAKENTRFTTGVFYIQKEHFGEEMQKLFINRQPNMEELEDQLDDVVGLDEVKEKLRRVLSYLQLVQAQEQHRMSGIVKVAKPEPGHYLFSGNPGTGKTMISEKLGIALSSMGLIGKYTPVRRTGLDLISTVQGANGIEKLKEELKSYVGGVLVIDEAHQLYEYKNSGGGVVIKCLLDPMLEHAHDLCVVFCCYRNMVDALLSCDDGLARRISDVFEFPDYSPAQITEIFEGKAKKEGFYPDEEVLKQVEACFEAMSAYLENGSSAEKMLKEIKVSISLRLRKLHGDKSLLKDVVDQNPDLTKSLYEILPEDVKSAQERMLASMQAKRSRKINGVS